MNLKQASAQALRLRSVRAEDCKMIWEWANDPTIRSVSFSSESISWESHSKWFSAKLQDPNCLFFIVLTPENIPIGQIRYEIHGDEAVVSVSLAPDQRGQGYGRQIIQSASQKIFGSTPVSLIHAYIKPDNLSSIGAFTKAGFLYSKAVEVQGNLAYDYTMQRDMEKNMIKTCPLCGASVSENRFSLREFVYKQCPSCGSLFVANDLSFFDLANYYSKDYYEADSSDDKERKGYPSYRNAQESIRDSFKQKLQVVRKYVTSGCLLDAGAAYGTFLQLASESYSCVGLELSEYAAKTAREEFHMDVRSGTIEKAPFPDANFDVIVMWDIIEHLKDPVAALQEVHRMLKPGGFCFISTDDVNNWLVKLLGTKWWGIAPPLHVCHFSKRGMEAAFERAGGFNAIQIEKDWRRYGLTEIIKHFGTSYRNKFLSNVGAKLSNTLLGKITINLARPEQFITVARKAS